MLNIDKARSRAGRVGTVAGTAALTAALFTPQALPLAAPCIIGAAGIAAAISLRPWRKDLEGEVTALYLASPTVLLGELITFHQVDGATWQKLVASAVWAAGTWWIRPSQVARFMVAKPGADGASETSTGNVVIPAPATAPRTPEDRLTAFWAEHVAITIAANTYLERCEVRGPHDFRAEIVAPLGRPVPTISLTALSALTDIPEELITISPVPGSGTGRKQLTVSSGQPDAPEDPDDLHTHWTKRVAPQAMPGATITAIRYGSSKTGRDA